MSTRIALVCAPLLGAALVLACTRLGSKPFWVDESIAVLPAHAIHTYGVPRSPFDLDYMAWQLQDQLWDPSAPLYRYVVAGITAVTGFNEGSTRGISIAFALLALIASFRLFAHTDGAPTAWIAVTVLACSWMFVEHAREARHFTFVLCAIATCLMLLERAPDDEWARVWWPAALTAALLGHSISYLIVPVVVFYAAWARAPLFTRRGLPVYAAAWGIWVAVVGVYWRTLPFVHRVDCTNRTDGCDHNPYFYGGTLIEFVRGAPAPSPWFALLSPGVWLLAVGVILTVGRLRRERHHALYLLWLLVPLAYLSVQELKFPRYLFYVLPAVALLVARGAVAVAGLVRFAPSAVAAVLVLVLVAKPQVSAGLHPKFLDAVIMVVQSGALNWARAVLATPDDNWQHTRAKSEYLRAHMQPGDVVVATMDDAGLGYYLGTFVYGFLNSAHDDRFFLDLLADAARRDAKVWLVNDDLHRLNCCHTPLPELHNVDCREKYRGFFNACNPKHPQHDPRCMRFMFPP